MSEPRIHQLEEKVIKKIAAGEVIHYPENVVKELLENALDAGSQMVTISLENGGYSLISVDDDGCGICADDIPVACRRHTTSKVNNFKDIQKVTTYGFRGEALFSMSCVSHLTISSKTEGSEFGVSGDFCDGEIISGPSIEPRTKGTSVVIRDLFYNNPEKLIACPDAKNQSKSILRIAQRYAIAHPEVSICVLCEGREKLRTNGFSTHEDVLSLLFGISAESSYFPMHIDLGYKTECDLLLGSPSAKKQLKESAIFINRRLVQCDHIKKSITGLYNNFLMKGEKPFLFVMMTIPPEKVDVNVHPTKKDVYFSNEQAIIDRMCDAIFDELKERAKNRKFSESRKTKTKINPLSLSPITRKTTIESREFTREVIPKIETDIYTDSPTSSQTTDSSNVVNSQIETTPFEGHNTERRNIFEDHNTEKIIIKDHNTERRNIIEESHKENMIIKDHNTEKIIIKDHDKERRNVLEENVVKEKRQISFVKQQSDDENIIESQRNDSICKVKEDADDEVVSEETDAIEENDDDEKEEEISDSIDSEPSVEDEDSIIEEDDLQEQNEAPQMQNDDLPEQEDQKESSDSEDVSFSQQRVRRNPYMMTMEMIKPKQPNDIEKILKEHSYTQSLSKDTHIPTSIASSFSQKQMQITQFSPDRVIKKSDKFNILDDLKFAPKSMSRIDPNEQTLEQVLAISNAKAEIKQEPRNVGLISCAELIEAEKKKMYEPLSTLFRCHSFVGFVGLKYALIGADETLYAVHLFQTLRVLFYQLFLVRIGNFGTIKFDNPINIEECANIECDYGKEISEAMTEHSELLEDLFSIKVENGCITTMPIICTGYAPTFTTLPLFLSRLKDIQWDFEKDCIAKFADEISMLYAPIEEDINSVNAGKVQEMVKLVVMPELKSSSFFPPFELYSNLSVIRIRSLHEMYKIFERN